MSNDYAQGRLQRIEEHLREIDEQISVLAAVDDGPAKQRIAQTFGTDARAVIVFRGIQQRMTQQQIADALKARNLPLAQQPRVSEMLSELEERGFIKRLPDGSYGVQEGWDRFGLEKTLKKTLKIKKVDDLG